MKIIQIFNIFIEKSWNEELSIEVNVDEIFSGPDLIEPKHLPCLEVEKGVQFFMTDAAVKFLMHGIEEDSDIRSQVSFQFFNRHQ